MAFKKNVWKGSKFEEKLGVEETSRRLDDRYLHDQIMSISLVGLERANITFYGYKIALLAGANGWIAIDFPDEVTIKEMQLWGTGDGEVILIRGLLTDNNVGSNMVGGVFPAIYKDVSNNKIDNTKYQYYINVGSDALGNPGTVYGIRIKYEY